MLKVIFMSLARCWGESQKWRWPLHLQNQTPVPFNMRHMNGTGKNEAQFQRHSGSCYLDRFALPGPPCRKTSLRKEEARSLLLGRYVTFISSWEDGAQASFPVLLFGRHGKRFGTVVQSRRIAIVTVHSQRRRRRFFFSIQAFRHLQQFSQLPGKQRKGGKEKREVNEGWLGKTGKLKQTRDVRADWVCLVKRTRVTW